MIKSVFPDVLCLLCFLLFSSVMIVASFYYLVVHYTWNKYVGMGIQSSGPRHPEPLCSLDDLTHRAEELHFEEMKGPLGACV